MLLANVTVAEKIIESKRKTIVNEAITNLFLTKKLNKSFISITSLSS